MFYKLNTPLYYFLRRDTRLPNGLSSWLLHGCKSFHPSIGQPTFSILPHLTPHFRTPLLFDWLPEVSYITWHRMMPSGSLAAAHKRLRIKLLLFLPSLLLKSDLGFPVNFQGTWRAIILLSLGSAEKVFPSHKNPWNFQQVR